MNLELFLEKYGAEYIQSRSNRKTVDYSKLAEKKYRDQSRLFLAEGVKLTEEALKYSREGVVNVVIAQTAVERASEESPYDRVIGIAKTANELEVKLSVFADSAFEKITTESAPQGVIAVVPYQNNLLETESFARWQNGRRLIMLEEIRDPGNLGTIMRSAEAMGIEGMILSKCADIYSPKVVRAAMGSLFRMPVFVTMNGIGCVNDMKNAGRRVLAAALGWYSLTLGDYEVDPMDCAVIGNEGHGMPDAMISECTACLRIPMAGNTESLNASAAAACILWEYYRGLEK